MVYVKQDSRVRKEQHLPRTQTNSRGKSNSSLTVRRSIVQINANNDKVVIEKKTIGKKD